MANIGDQCPNQHDPRLSPRYIINQGAIMCIECDNKRARHEASLREFWMEMNSG